MNYPPTLLNMPHLGPTPLSPTHRLFPRLSNTHAFPGHASTVYRPQPSAQEQQNFFHDNTQSHALYHRYRPYHPYSDSSQTESRFIPEYDSPVQYRSVRDVQVGYPAYNIQVHPRPEVPTIHPEYLGFHQNQPNPHDVTAASSWMSYPTPPHAHPARPGGVDICGAALTVPLDHFQRPTNQDQHGYVGQDVDVLPSATMSATSSLPFMNTHHSLDPTLDYGMPPSSANNPGTQPALFPGQGYSDDNGACGSNWNNSLGYALSPLDIADLASTTSPIPMSTRESSPSPSRHASSSHDYHEPSPLYHQQHYNLQDLSNPASTPGAGPSNHSFSRSDPPSRSISQSSSQPSSSFSVASHPSPPAKKPPKTHECSICHKVFPRPSGLRTHMNSHNGLKPYSCEFENCTRTFAVRSNATRHLRIHGIFPTPVMEEEPAPYHVDFNTPIISTDTPPDHLHRSPPPVTLRWAINKKGSQS